MVTSAYPIVVIGAGQAGLQVCDSLRKGGYDGRLILLGDEQVAPYQRPPLSKKFLTGAVQPERLAFRPSSYYEKIAAELRLGARVTRIDRAAHAVILADGEIIHYSRLALTTGSRVRALACPGGDLDEVHYVRTLADGERLAARLARATRVVVVGGGFIGLEVAAIARELGLEVTVIEALQRLMARAVSPLVADFYADLHRRHGVAVELGRSVRAIRPAAGGVEVELDDASRHAADCVVVGIGVIPNSELAEASGLACNNGIVVDGGARTSDPEIVAAGDCTFHYNGFLAREIRLESVQNAVDQAKVAAASLCGESATYYQVPWFWSDQYDVKLQMAGVGMPYDACALRGEVGPDGFSVFYFRAGALVGADSINRPAEHMACRKLLMQGTMLSPAAAADRDFDLLALARS